MPLRRSSISKKRTRKSNPFQSSNRNLTIPLLIPTTIRLLPPPRHPRSLLLLLRKIPIFLRPPPRPHLRIRHHALWASCPHPEPHERQAAPERDAADQPHPEHDGVDEHVENFEGQKEDQEEEGEGCEVRFLRQGVDEGRCVGLQVVGVGEKLEEVGSEGVGRGEEVGRPVWKVSVCSGAAVEREPYLGRCPCWAVCLVVDMCVLVDALCGLLR